jgi:hypothetical protein
MDKITEKGERIVLSGKVYLMLDKESLCFVGKLFWGNTILFFK